MTHRLKQLGVKTVVALGLGLSAWTSGEGQRLVWLGVRAGASQSDAVAVSSDGSVVVGNSNGGVRWVNGALQDVIPFRTVDASDDCNTILGWLADENDPSCYWVEIKLWVSGQIRTIATGFSGSCLYDSYEDIYASCISGDGSTAVVNEFSINYNACHHGQGASVYRAPNWSYVNIQWGLGSRNAFYVTGISTDGSVVVGGAKERWTDWDWEYNYCWIQENLPAAFRWHNGSSQILLLSGNSSSSASTVSGDGSVVFGTTWANNQEVTFRWTPASGMEVISNQRIYLVAATYDGATAVGSRYISGNERAFRWVSGVGVQNLNEVYSSLLSPGSYLSAATDISPDGRYIVGRGYNAATGRHEAYWLDTQASQVPGDVNGDGCVDDADLLAVLFNFGQSGSGLPEDVNGDGTVDDADLLEVLFNFGGGC